METNELFTSLSSSRQDILICSVLLKTSEVEGRVPRAACSVFFVISNVCRSMSQLKEFFLLKLTLHHCTIKFQAYSKIIKLKINK